MGNAVLEQVKSVKYLGVMLHKQVTWANQIEYIKPQLSRSAGIFSKLRYYLNTETRMEMYHALFNSHLLYALLYWGSVCPTTLNCLQIVQNKAMRNMMKSP